MEIKAKKTIDIIKNKEIKSNNNLSNYKVISAQISAFNKLKAIFMLMLKRKNN